MEVRVCIFFVTVAVAVAFVVIFVCLPLPLPFPSLLPLPLALPHIFLVTPIVAVTSTRVTGIYCYRYHDRYRYYYRLFCRYRCRCYHLSRYHYEPVLFPLLLSFAFAFTGNFAVTLLPLPMPLPFTVTATATVNILPVAGLVTSTATVSLGPFYRCRYRRLRRLPHTVAVSPFLLPSLLTPPLFLLPLPSQLPLPVTVPTTVTAVVPAASTITVPITATVPIAIAYFDLPTPPPFRFAAPPRLHTASPPPSPPPSPAVRCLMFAQEITEFLSGEDLLRVKPFIGQGNSGGAKARAAAAAAEAAKSSASNTHDYSGNGGGNGNSNGNGGRGGGEGEADDALAPKERLRGQTQKEQKVGVAEFYIRSRRFFTPDEAFSLLGVGVRRRPSVRTSFRGERSVACSLVWYFWIRGEKLAEGMGALFIHITEYEGVFFSSRGAFSAYS